MKRYNIFVISLFFSLAIVLAACGGEDSKADKEEDEDVVEAEEDDQDELKDEPEEEDEEDEDKPEEVEEGEIFNPAIAEETEGDVELIYTNDDAGYEHDIDGFVIKADEYQIVKVTDMNETASARFDGEQDGYIMTTKASIDNTTDTPLHYSVYMNVQMEDAYDYATSNPQDYIPEEHQLTWDDEVGVYDAGEKVDFWLTTRMTTEEFEKLDTLEPKFIIEGGITDANDEDDGYHGDEAIFDFTYSGDQAKETEGKAELYADKLTTDNIGTKELIFEETDIGASEDLDGLEVTVEGVQYAEVVPNESSEARFENFDGDDLVAVTVHLTIDNQSDELIHNPLTGWLVANDGETKIQASGMIDNYSPREMEAGDTGEHYMVFLMKEKYYDIYETFELEVGPFLGEEGYALKERKMNFDIPSE